MSEPIRDAESAVRALGALPVPVGSEPTLKGVAEDVIARAMRQGRTVPALIAEALDSAQLLQSPETAAETERLRELLREATAGAAVADELTAEWRKRAEAAEARLAEYERPADEDPITYTLTEQADAALQNRVTELEVAAVEARAALAALCHDLDDPGSMALGALFLLQQATIGTPMQPGEAVPTVYRAQWDSVPLGWYTNPAAARAHCEDHARRDLPTVELDWIEDEEDGVAELVAAVGDEEHPTGYAVASLEIASEYDAEADE